MEPGAKPNILVVDDEVTNLHLLKTILKALDVNLIVAKSGLEALSKIQDQEIALALVDIRMPGMDGVELAMIIRNDKSRGKVPIIFITAHTKDELELEKCYESGIVDFILKPFRHKILLSKVKVFLELYRQKHDILEHHLELEKSTNELVQLNQTIKESNDLNNSLLQTIPFGLDIVDEHGNILFLSENLEKHFDEETIGKKCWELYRDDKSQCLGCPLISGINIGETSFYEAHGVMGGKIFQISYTGMLFQGKKAMLEIFQDITSKKQIENALIESEKMYRTLLNASPEGIIIIDIKGRITDISDIVLELFGAENKNEFIGAIFFHIIPRKEVKKMKNVLSKTRSEGLVQNIEFILTRKNQSQFICELSTTLIQEADGKPKGYMAIIRDISQRKKIEQQLIRTERMVSLGEMASAMAHEINQPLLSITLGIENLFLKIQQAKVVDDTYFHNKSEKIFDDVLRIERIIDHVRDFSRDHDDYIFTSFDINDSIKNAISMISEQFKHHGIGLTIKLDKKVHRFIGNTYRFEQVILNLLTNAKDALEEKMKTSKSDFEKTIVIRTYHDAHTNYVKVIDNGSGIKSDDIHRIMLPFYTTKEASKGTGLGLSISFEIIKEMNGNIDIESDLFQGTTFRITLPIPEIKEKQMVKVL